MANPTPNLQIDLPIPGSTTSWGQDGIPGTLGLNSVINQLDAVFSAAGTSVSLNVGSGKTISVAGTLQVTGTALFGQDGTGATGNTIRAGDKTGNNVTGTNLIIQAGNGTGTNATTSGSGKILFNTAPANAAGASSDPTVMATRMTITKDGYVGIGQDTPLYNVDIGAGGTASTNGQQSIRLNGSNAGTGSNGGSILTIANNSVSTGAIGNYSSVLGTTSPTTAYTADLTIASSSSLRFLTGATIAGGNPNTEKLRIGTAGQIGIWDASLDPPAINYGTSGQVLRSNGSSAAASWGSSTAVLIAPGASAGSVGAGTTFTINTSSIPTGYKVLELFLYGLSHNNGNARSLQIEISSDGSTWSSADQCSPSKDSATSVTGTIKIVDASLDSGTRYIISNTSTGDDQTSYTYRGNPSISGGAIRYIRFSWSTSTNFDAGNISLVGYN